MEQEANRVIASLEDQPAEQAAILELMGEAYSLIAHPEKAVSMLERAVKVRRGLGEPIPLADALALLGTARFESGIIQTAGDAHREALVLITGNGQENTARHARAIGNVAVTVTSMNGSNDALDEIRQAIAVYKATGTDDPATIGRLQYQLGHVAYELSLIHI